jgi:hypothetical protein
MADRSQPAYGTPNWEMIGRWLHLDPADDGPFWALNLMKYHPVAQYADGSGTTSGREADDAYAPLGPLAAIGAVVAFHGDVLDQPLGEPAWDRVGIVRYPSRAAFFAMQQRDDFKQQHVHKEAGMEFTIVMSCLPTASDPSATTDGALVLVVDRAGGDTDLGGAAEVAAFTVEGVIVGDERTFDRVRFVRAADQGAVDAIVEAASSADEAHILVLDPAIDRLVDTIVTGPSSS